MPRRWPAVAVDAILVHDGRLVAVIRANEPFRGLPALPGGFVGLGETAVEAVVREVREETGLGTRVRHLVGAYSDPSRDPRGHVVSVVYELERTGGDLRAGSDAARLTFLDPDAPGEMAFDHARIVADWRRG
ncbi:MAG: NUDIX domain-containing protein [Methanobacteriota archaeon]